MKDHPTKRGIVPGKPELSEVFQRITTSDSSLVMPVASSKLPRLTENEVAIIKKWIEQGAKYEPHWAFTVPKKSTLPAVSDDSWPKNEIDYFILNKKEEKGLSPNK